MTHDQLSTVSAVLACPRRNDFEGVYLHDGSEPTELGPVFVELDQRAVRGRCRGVLARDDRSEPDGLVEPHVLGGELARTWDGRTTMPDYAAIEDDKELKKLFK